MISQIGIAVFGLGAVFLSQHSSHASRRWAPVLGLCGQPFWFYATYTAEQWGIFVLSIFYAASWAMGLRNQWFRA